MQLFVVAVFDRAAQAFSRPFFCPSLGLAIRSFSDEVNRDSADNPMFKHADDYDLFHIGGFDDSTGELSKCTSPMSICIGKQVKVL